MGLFWALKSHLPHGAAKEKGKRKKLEDMRMANEHMKICFIYLSSEKCKLKPHLNTTLAAGSEEKRERLGPSL